MHHHICWQFGVWACITLRASCLLKSRPRYLYDDLHFTSEGYHFMAQRVGEALLEAAAALSPWDMHFLVKCDPGGRSESDLGRWGCCNEIWCPTLPLEKIYRSWIFYYLRLSWKVGPRTQRWFGNATRFLSVARPKKWWLLLGRWSLDETFARCSQVGRLMADPSLRCATSSCGNLLNPNLIPTWAFGKGENW